MILPRNAFDQQVVPGNLYYFVNPDLVNTTEPHYFVCVSKTPDQIVFMVCCTSKFNSVKYLIEKNNHPYSTLVTLNPTSQNGLTMETHINCNSIFEKSTQWLYEKYVNQNLTYKGFLEEDEYEQILRGVIDSPLVETHVIKDCQAQLDNMYLI